MINIIQMAQRNWLIDNFFMRSEAEADENFKYYKELTLITTILMRSKY